MLDLSIGMKLIASHFYQLTVASIEQVDIVPTLATLLNVPIPKENLGVTLLPYISTDRSNFLVLLFVLRNAVQFRKLDKTSGR